MRPTSTYPSALEFQSETAGNDAGRRTLFAAAKVVLETLGDSLDAAHDYERLRARGVAHDAATRHIFANHFKAR